MVPHPGDIRPGDMMLAKPKHFQPRPSCSVSILNEFMTLTISDTTARATSEGTL